jgi:tetratricopeptide (TPR) repeat protein
VQWPIIRPLFVRYLEVGSSGLGRAEVEEFYRSTAEAFGRTEPRLAAIAHDHLAAMMGEQALSADDHYRLTFTATDEEADAARLERVLASDRKLDNRADLQMLLLGRYLGFGQTEKAQALVAAMEEADPAAHTTANAIYNLGVDHQMRNNPDDARNCFQKVIDAFPDTHWAEYARKRIGDLPEPIGDAMTE